MADHGVQGVQIDGAKVKVLCVCGNATKAAASETDAMKLHEAHLKRSGG